MALRSEIILCNNIRLDKDYINVLNYSQNDMLTLCRNNATASADDYSFIRETGAIIVGFDYATCLSSNYMAYQNKDYSNKWFFAFINKVEYVSEKATRIFFTIDSWSTFYDDWVTNNVFVYREHVSDDTFGLHTLPEGLETGDYVNVENYSSTNIGSDISICVATTKHIDTNKVVSTPRGKLVNGIFQGLDYFIFSDYPDYSGGIKKKEQAVYLFIHLFSTTSGISADDIVNIFMIPNSIIGNNYTEETYQNDSGSLPYKVKLLTDSSSEIILERYLLRDNYNLAGGYIPKNKKLLCFPYRYILASNGTGQDVVYNWEYFEHDNNNVKFNSIGDLTPNCSMKCVPQNYKGLANNYEEAINYSKYPTCSWVYDAYLNWQTQNNVNNALRVAGGIVKIVGGIGVAKAGETALMSASTKTDIKEANTTISNGENSQASGIGSIFDVAMEQYQHTFDPNQSRGNVNSGDINFTVTKNDIRFYKMSIKPEYARILDGIFNRFGYVVNTFKKPNIYGRPYWNFVQVTNGEKTVRGNIPQIYIDEINNAFIRGVTIWHDHSNIGNFTLDNSL